MKIRFASKKVLRFQAAVWFILVATLLVSALSAQNQLSDPVLEKARQAGMIASIGKSQTIKDVTVTLDWAYADVQRLVIGYSIQTKNGVKLQDLISPFGTDQARLSDDKGAQFSFASGMGAPAESTDHITTSTEFYPQALVPGKNPGEVMVDNHYFAHPDPTITLKWELSLGGFTVPEGIPPQPGSSLKPGETVPSAGTFTFDFTIPLYPSLTRAPNQTVQAAGVTMTLQQISMTPTKTSVQVCYAAPDQRDWMPEGSVKIGDKTGLLTGTSLLLDKSQPIDYQHICRELSFSLFYDQQPATITVAIDHLSTSMPEGPGEWLQIKDVLAKEGIIINVKFEQGSHGGSGVSIDIVSIPKGVDFNDAVNAAREKLGNRLRGDWTFTVKMP